MKKHHGPHSNLIKSWGTKYRKSSKIRTNCDFSAVFTKILLV